MWLLYIILIDANYWGLGPIQAVLSEPKFQLHLIANWRRETVSPASNIKHVYCQLMSRHCFCLTTGVNVKSWGSISSNVLRSTPKALQYLNLLPQVTTEVGMDKIHPAATVWNGLAGRVYKPKVILNDWRWTGLIFFFNSVMPSVCAAGSANALKQNRTTLSVCKTRTISWSAPVSSSHRCLTFAKFTAEHSTLQGLTDESELQPK